MLAGRTPSRTRSRKPLSTMSCSYQVPSSKRACRCRWGSCRSRSARSTRGRRRSRVVNGPAVELARQESAVALVRAALAVSPFGARCRRRTTSRRSRRRSWTGSAGLLLPALAGVRARRTMWSAVSLILFQVPASVSPGCQARMIGKASWSSCSQQPSCWGVAPATPLTGRVAGERARPVRRAVARGPRGDLLVVPQPLRHPLGLRGVAGGDQRGGLLVEVARPDPVVAVVEVSPSMSSPHGVESEAMLAPGKSCPRGL